MKTRHLFLTAAALIVFAAPTLAADTKTAANPAKPETQYVAIFIAGKKAGHGKSVRTVAADKVTTTEFMRMTIARMNVPMTIEVTSTALETPEGKPLGFEAIQNMGTMVVTTKGVIDNRGRTTVTTTMGSNVRTTTFDWPKDALLSEGVRLASLKKGLKAGTSYKLKVFDPSMQKALDAEIEVGRKEKVDLLGRVVALTKISTTLVAPTGRITTTTYVDDRLHVKKMQMPMFGQQFELIECSKAFALSKDNVVDFFDHLLLKSPVSLNRASRAAAITYHLKPTKNEKLTVPPGDNQTIRTMTDGTVVVTVRPVAASKGSPMPYKGKDQAALAAMQPTRYVQSDDKKVIALARKAVGNCDDPAEAAKIIQAFVYKYISKKSLAIGYATASEVAANPEGDCTEHAVLAAGMCRALGIPTQVVVGLVYVPAMAGRKHVFGPHAWFQSYIGGKWVVFDAAMKSADARRITLGSGDGSPDDFFGLITTLGYFKITKVVVEN